MRMLDLVIVVVYLAGMVVIGLLAKGKNDDAEDYFTAKGTLNTWFSTIVVGLSIAGTFFSGISFIAYPSVVYSRGVLIVIGMALFCLPVSYVVLRYWFLPRYLAGGWKYPYEILEVRFGSATRTVAASLYVLMRIGWMAAMIYAPTVAIMAMGNFDDRWFWPIVLITGLTNTVYTVFSGVRGVIVTEAVQMLVIMIGIAATIGCAVWMLPVDMGLAWEGLRASDRLEIAKFSMDPTAGMTLWTVLIGVTIANFGNYMSDQMSLQRYLATGDVRAACRSFAFNVLGVIVVLALLAGVGLSLFAYYSHVTDPTLPTNPDRIFPHFVATRLPVGAAGLVLAALLAATSIPSGINTLAGVLTLDFHARIRPGMTEQQRVRWGKFYSLLIGLVATFAAGVVARLGTLFDLAQVILGIFAGPLLSCMMIAVSNLRCRQWAMLAGIACGWSVGIGITQTSVNSLWVAPASALTTAGVALGLSVFGRVSGKSSVPVTPVSVGVDA